MNDIQKPATEIEIAEAIRRSEPTVALVIRRLAFERDSASIRDRAAYDLGYRNGLEAFAWWKDGVQYVGTSGKTLDEAIRTRREIYNYATDKR